MKTVDEKPVEITPAVESVNTPTNVNVEVNAEINPESADAGADGIVEANTTKVTYGDKIKNLVVAGGRMYKGLRVKNVLSSEEDNYDRVTMVIDGSVPAKVSPDNGITFTTGQSSNIFTSTFALAGTIKEDEDLSFLANYIISSPKIVNLLFNGSSIDIIQMTYPANVPIVNPFSTKENDSGRIYDHEVIINYIVKIKPGRTGLKMIDKLADKIMESAIDNVL